MSDVHFYSEEGLKKLRDELYYMKTKGRHEIAAAIEEAREKGDLKENAEYKAAKEAQNIHEAKIAHLEGHLANSRAIDESRIDLSKIFILSTTKVKNMQTGKIHTYTLVPGKESDLSAGKISVESPVGRGLLGKQVGEVADIDVPAGKISFEVLEITRN